jgi:hypothetical protein
MTARHIPSEEEPYTSELLSLGDVAAPAKGLPDSCCKLRVVGHLGRSLPNCDVNRGSVVGILERSESSPEGYRVSAWLSAPEFPFQKGPTGPASH